MCGRFAQQRPTAELAELFDAEPLVDDPGGHFNLAPTDPAAVVVERGDRRAVTTYAWGLCRTGRRIPAAPRGGSTPGPRRWRPARPSPRASGGGAASSRPTASTSGVATAVRPTPVSHPPPRPGAARAGRPVVGLARPADRRARRTFTIVTTTPNEPIARLHDRMPVVLEPDAWDLWLDPGTVRRRRAPRPAPTGADGPARDRPGATARQQRPERRSGAARSARLIGSVSRRPVASPGPRPPRRVRRPGSAPRSSSAANSPTVRAKTPSGS